jgi:SAM-dependent methyltransferase
MNAIRSLLALPELKHWPHDLNAPETTTLHGSIIRRKPFLHALYCEWYYSMKQLAADLPAGQKIEIGSGAGFLKEVVPEVITTDVLALPTVDRVISAEKLPFDDGSVAAILGVDVFHHIPNVESFLREADRCLLRGGRIVLIEPANSVWGRFIYQHFHHEPFDPSAGWTFAATGPLSGANGALPWIVFVRDRKLFQEWFPRLKVLSITRHTPLRYLLSGGVSMRSLTPAWTFGLWSGLEFVLSPLSRVFSMFQTIVVEKQ